VHTFRLPHALHIVKQFSETSGISNKLLSLGFGILLLLRWILLAFQILILLEVALTERALLVPSIFSNPLLFAGLLKKQSLIAQSTIKAEYVAAAPKFYGLCRP
jgi:hypothetical protein